MTRRRGAVGSRVATRSGAPPSADARADRRAQIAIAGVVAVGVVLRLLVLRAPGYPNDVATFQAWGDHLVQVGPGAFYSPDYFSDYPPAYLYVLWLLAALFDGEFHRLAVKAASIPADIAIALGAAALVWRTAGRASAVVAASLWSLSPGAIYAGPYWGQVDAVGGGVLFAALLAAGGRRWALAGVLAAVAAMIKPQLGIGAIVIGVASVFELIRHGRWRPLPTVAVTGVVTTLALGVPFRAGPVELYELVREAAGYYSYSSLYAFNVWAVVTDFFTPDGPFVVRGGLLLIAGLLVACVPLWRRRDTATLLASAAIAAFAFYFLPTRAHERYLFPAFVLLLPLAATRARLLWPYVVLLLGFTTTLYFVISRTPGSGVAAPEWLESTLFARQGQIALALLLIGTAALITWRLFRGEARLDEPSLDVAWAVPEPTRGWRLPTALAPGGVPTRRDVLAAFLVALVVLATRGFRLDHPRDMYFDEVYHARTAFELLAQREPYEWTHPHLAKELIALGIVAFGADRVVGTEDAPEDVVAFAVENDGTRLYQRAFETELRERDGATRTLALGVRARFLAPNGDRVIALTDDSVLALPLTQQPSGTQLPRRALPIKGPVTSLATAGGRIFVGSVTGVVIYPTFDASPLTLEVPAVALTAKPDGGELYVLDPDGDVRIVDPASGRELRRLRGGGPGRAIAYAQGPNRLFVARAGAPLLDVHEVAGGERFEVPLANGRTGAFGTGATALATVPRTQFVYALADGRAVVVEPHGASPYAAIPVRGSFLGVDGEGDALLVAGADGVERIETGRHGLAWRLPGVIAAAVLAFFLVLLARRLFAAPLVAWLAGLVVLLDTSMFAQARIGMNDVYVTTFVVAAWYFIVAAHRPRRSAALDLLIAGVLVGLGAAAKWAAAYTLAGIFVACIAVTAYAYERGRPGTGGPLDLLGGRGRNAALLFLSFAVVPLAIYLGSYLSWFGGPMFPYGWTLWETTQQMYWYHSSLTAPHCAGSPWWAWPLDLKPVYWYFAQSAGGSNGYIYDAGNIVLFWGALPAAALVVALAIRTRSAALGLVSLAMLAQFVAWIPISRVLFAYHFFTALPFYLLCLAAILAVLRERWPTAVSVYLGVATVAFVLFYPYVSGLPIPGEIASAYEILPTWHYDPTFYPTESCPTPVSATIATGLTVTAAWIVEGAVLAGAVAVALGASAARDVLDRLGL